MSEMTCQVYTMKVNEFAHVAFTDGFVNGLRSLHYASSLPQDSLEADAIFRFVSLLFTFPIVPQPQVPYGPPICRFFNIFTV